MALRWYVRVAPRMPTASAISCWLATERVLSVTRISQTDRDPPVSASAASKARPTRLAVLASWRPIGVMVGLGITPPYASWPAPQGQQRRCSGSIAGRPSRRLKPRARGGEHVEPVGRPGTVGDDDRMLDAVAGEGVALGREPVWRVAVFESGAHRDFNAADIAIAPFARSGQHLPFAADHAGSSSARRRSHRHLTLRDL